MSVLKSLLWEHRQSNDDVCCIPPPRPAVEAMSPEIAFVLCRHAAGHVFSEGSSPGQASLDSGGI